MSDFRYQFWVTVYVPVTFFRFSAFEDSKFVLAALNPGSPTLNQSSLLKDDCNHLDVFCWPLRLQLQLISFGCLEVLRHFKSDQANSRAQQTPHALSLPSIWCIRAELFDSRLWCDSHVLLLSCTFFRSHSQRYTKWLRVNYISCAVRGQRISRLRRK